LTASFQKSRSLEDIASLKHFGSSSVLSIIVILVRALSLSPTRSTIAWNEIKSRPKFFYFLTLWLFLYSICIFVATPLSLLRELPGLESNICVWLSS
jgi:NADH:ubiquinone oxidoreductase subunit 4 (subunit M)